MAGFIAGLRRMADALESGEDFAADVDGETVAVPRTAHMSLALAREEGAVGMEFRLTWSEVGTGDEEDGEDEEEATAARPLSPADPRIA